MIRRFQIGLWVLLLCALGSRPAVAQKTAEAYFHEAAQHYIAEDVSAARGAVESGLERAPSDPRLLALQKKLQETRRRRTKKTAENGRQQQSGEQNGSNGEGDRSSPSGQRSRSEPGGQDPSSDGPRQQGQRHPSDEGDPSDASEQRSRATDPANASGVRSPGTLSRAQAEHLLRALEVQEQRLLRSLQIQDTKRPPVEKDW